MMDNIENNNLDLFIKVFEEYYSAIDDDEETKINILVRYLYYVNKNKISITEEHLNMSFQDIIYNKYGQWQFGYSGTTSINLTQYDPSESFVFKNKIPDLDEAIEVNLSLRKFGAEDIEDIKVTHINRLTDVNENIQIILDVLNSSGESRGFVDLSGVFLNYDNKQIAEIIKDKLPGKNIIYFDEKNNPIDINTNVKSEN